MDNSGQANRLSFKDILQNSIFNLDKVINSKPRLSWSHFRSTNTASLRKQNVLSWTHLNDMEIIIEVGLIIIHLKPLSLWDNVTILSKSLSAICIVSATDLASVNAYGGNYLTLRKNRMETDRRRRVGRFGTNQHLWVVWIQEQYAGRDLK